MFIQIFVNSLELIYQIQTNTQPDGLNNDQWVITKNQNSRTISTCNGIDIYGGYNTFTHDTIIQKVLFSIPPHFLIRIEIDLWWFNLELQQLIFDNDNTQISLISSSTLQTRSCPEISIEYQFQNLVYELSHQRRNFIFKMFQAYFEKEDATWGFNSFKISVYNCPPEYLQCLGYNDLNYGFWSKLQFSFIQCELEDSDIQQWGGGIVDNVDEFGCCKGINSNSFENSFILPQSDKILIRFLINKNTNLIIWINENIIEIQQKGVVEIIVEKQFGLNLNIKIRDINNLSDWMIRDLEIYYQLSSNYIEKYIIIPYINLECREFVNQFCLDCQEGWELDVLQNICITQCGDNIIQGFEECDDGNQIEYDGCYLCMFQCIQFCQICINGICIQCLNGYSFNNNQECTINCQGNIIIPYYNEECVGELFIQFNGCFQCLKQMECNYGCIQCDINRICYQCQTDFILIQGKCLSNCGRNDQILYEDCEDIELKCPLYCIKCNLQQCLICDEQYELFEDGQCRIEKEEEEEDLNNNNQLIQKVDMICRNYPYECNYYKSPQLILSYLNITLNKQYISIEFTQQVKSLLQIPLSQTLIIEIFNISKQMYSYDIIIIQDSSEFINFVQLILEIEIYELLEIKPYLFLNLNQSLINSFEQCVIQDYAILILEFSQYLNENEKLISYKLESIAKSTIYSMFSICGISLFFGNLQYIFVILNMIQYLSILRYFNLQFPQNLEIYFQVYDILTIQPLLNLLPNELLNNIMFMNIQKESSGKFKYYGLNADLISNLYCQILQCLIFLLFGLIGKYIIRIVYNYIFNQRYFKCMDRLIQLIKPSYVLKLNQLFYKGIKSLILQIQELITYEGIKQLLFLNGWDIIFKILLYLKSIELSNNSRDIIQLIIVIIIFISYLFIILYSQWKQQHITLKQLQNKNTFQILNLFKQILQLYILIFLDCSQIIQLGFFFIISLVNLKLIFIYRHSIVNSQFLINAIVEGSVLLFTLTSFIYIEDFEQYIQVQYKIKCGWFHIVILSIGLFSEIIMIIKDTFKNIMKNCKKQEEVNNNMPFIV